MLVISDTHIGVIRSGGTTHTSAEQVREYLLQKFAEHLLLADEVLINGDLFDTYSIPLIDLFRTHQIISDWLAAGDRRVHLVPGNHCLSKNSENLSSFELMARLLQARFGERVRYLQGGCQVKEGIYVISHVRNQDIFDHELTQVPEGMKYLLLHCNFDSPFACDADNSLNLSREQAKALKARGITMVLGHEHQGRELLGGSVIIVGNQVPSSVSDCMSHGDGQRAGTKRALILEDGGHRFTQTWSVDDEDGWFARVDWKELAEVIEEGRGFIRVEGEATRDEAPAVVRAIAAFRQRSQSFVVTNAVHIEQAEGLGDLEDSIEDVRTVDIMALLLEQLDERESAIVRALLAEKEMT